MPRAYLFVFLIKKACVGMLTHVLNVKKTYFFYFFLLCQSFSYEIFID